MEKAYYSIWVQGLFPCSTLQCPGCTSCTMQAIAFCSSGTCLRSETSLLKNGANEPMRRTWDNTLRNNEAESSQALRALIFFFFFLHLQLTNTPVHVACYTHNSNSVIKQRVSSSHSFHIIDNCFKVTAKLSMYLGTAKHLSPPGPLQLLFCPLQWAAGK